jgi:hypothetical protein
VRLSVGQVEKDPEDFLKLPGMPVEGVARVAPVLFFGTVGTSSVPFRV